MNSFHTLGFPLRLCSILLISLLFLGTTTSLFAQEPPPEYDPTQLPIPAEPPLARLGEPIYQQSCAPCHGPEGNSDGPTSGSLPSRPPLFSDPETTWTHSPGEYFHTTKFGRIQNLMPPWRNQLNDDQIWQAVAYSWYLHTDQTMVEEGALLYSEGCASCHGAQGAADGPDAPENLPSFTDLARMNALTQAELLAAWQTAHPEVGEGWSETEQRQVLGHIRSFSLVPPWTSPYQAGEGIIQGQVRNESVDGGSVAELTVAVTAYLDVPPSFEQIASFQTITDEDGRFTFDGLATNSGIFYLIETTYLDVRYTSQVVALSPISPTTDLTLSVFETTDDPSGLYIDRANWVFDYEPGALVIGQILSFGNQLDRTFTGRAVEGVDVPVTIELAIPEDAIGLQFQDGVIGGRYHQVGAKVYDTAPVLPGEATQQIFFGYRLAVDGDTFSLEQPVPYEIQTLNLLAAELAGLEFSPTGLAFVSTEAIEGNQYRLWVGQDLPAQPIAIQITGLLAEDDVDPRSFAEPDEGSSSDSTTQASGSPLPANDPLMPIAVPFAMGAVLMILLTCVLFWPRFKGGGVDREVALKDERERLIRQIAALDDQHELGQLETDAWSAERTALKNQLITVSQLGIESRASGS